MDKDKLYIKLLWLNWFKKGFISPRFICTTKSPTVQVLNHRQYLNNLWSGALLLFFCLSCPFGMTMYQRNAQKIAYELLHKSFNFLKFKFKRKLWKGNTLCLHGFGEVGFRGSFLSLLACFLLASSTAYPESVPGAAASAERPRLPSLYLRPRYSLANWET